MGGDYIGKEGRYSKGNHFTGIKGIEDAKDKSADEIQAILRNPSHGYTEEMINDEDAKALIKFIQMGQVDMYQYIDKNTGKILVGNIEAGEKKFSDNCAICHGTSGNLNIGNEESLGSLTRGNPQETFHKVLFGHPPFPVMPAMYKQGIETASDILKYLSTLP